MLSTNIEGIVLGAIVNNNIINARRIDLQIFNSGYYIIPLVIRRNNSDYAPIPNCIFHCSVTLCSTAILSNGLLYRPFWLMTRKPLYGYNSANSNRKDAQNKSQEELCPT